MVGNRSGANGEGGAVSDNAVEGVVAGELPGLMINYAPNSPCGIGDGKNTQGFSSRMPRGG